MSSIRRSWWIAKNVLDNFGNVIESVSPIYRVGDVSSMTPRKNFAEWRKSSISSAAIFPSHNICDHLFALLFESKRDCCFSCHIAGDCDERTWRGMNWNRVQSYTHTASIHKIIIAHTLKIKHEKNTHTPNQQQTNTHHNNVKSLKISLFPMTMKKILYKNGNNT